MKVKDIMSKNVVAVRDGESVKNAAEQMEKFGIGFAPVKNSEGDLCGIVTDRDLVVRGLAGGKETVKEVMTTDLITISPENSVIEAARLMARAKVRRLPVTNKMKTVGVLSLSDISRAEDMFAETAEAFCDICSDFSDDL